MTAEPAAKGQTVNCAPIFEKLIAMIGAARDAFNRHSRSSMEDLKNLQAPVIQEIETATRNLEDQMVRLSESERAALLRRHSILAHLRIMAENLAGLSEPLEKKIKDGVLFSDKAVSQTNYLFNQETGIIRSLLDIIKTDNEFLKKYTAEEGRNLVQSCINFATEHEARLIEGLCLPQAAPLFLAILDRIRMMGQHAVDIANLLAQKQ
jgi:Na+/phosphate symporter